MAAAALLAGSTIMGATPVAGQEMQDQDQGAPTGITVTEPTPLITVRPGPAVPPGPPPEMALPPIPASYSQPIGDFTMYMDVIATGPSTYGLFAAPGCVLDGVFKRGMKLVWRFELYDMSTRTRLTSQDNATVSVTLPDGTIMPAMFLPRGEPGELPPDAPWTWVAVWNIPPDYPLGPVAYTVNVTTADGRTGALTPISWGSFYPMVVD
jgi:hypothetical protein